MGITPIKSTICPNCKEYGLIRKYNSVSYFPKIRCKICNKLWTGKEAYKLSEIIKKNSLKLLSQRNRERRIRRLSEGKQYRTLKDLKPRLEALKNTLKI